MSAPILDSLKAMDTKLQETKSQVCNAQSRPTDDSPEKKKASDLESVDRFDWKNPLVDSMGIISGAVSIKELTL